MSVSQLLYVPEKFPRFCTDNPTKINEPAEEDKDDGFNLNAYVDSGWFNWFQNLNYEWTRRILGTVLGNWSTALLTSSGTPDSCIYWPIDGQNKWLHYFSDATPFTRRYYDPWHSSSVSRLGATEGTLSRVLSYDSSRLILADYINGIQHLVYSTDGQTWTSKWLLSLAEKITAIGIKRPLEDSNFIVVGFNLVGSIRYASVVTGSFTSPTTQRGYFEIADFCFMGNGNWLCLYKDGVTYVSTDDCDNWAVTSYTPAASLFMTAMNSVDYNPATNTVIAVGEDGDIARSPNSGTDWENVTIALSGRTINDLTKVIHVGAGGWVAVGEPITPSSGIYIAWPGILISIDDGKTWHMPAYSPFSIPTGFDDNADIVDVCCDGRCIRAMDLNGNIYISNAMPLSQ